MPTAKFIFASQKMDYYVSPCGRVYSHNRTTGGQRELSQCTTATGYMCTTCVGKQWRVHRLVAIAYIPNPDCLDTVDHIDGDKTNNHKDNLRWLSAADNTRATPKHKHDTGSEPVSISVNGKLYPSLASAARFIVGDAQRGSEDTVRGELRKYKQGLRPSWTMYGKYLIE